MKFKSLLILQFCLPVLGYCAEGNVQEQVLSNGLKVLVKEDHRSPVVVSQVWYKVGSSYEPSGITGASHMLEHMMFKGTDKHPAGEFSRIIAENGGDENAFTGRDYTAYFQTMEKSKLPVSLALEADRMRHLHLLPEELVKELEVVHEERRMRTDDKPRAKAEEYFMAMVFSNSPYRNPVIGWPGDIENYKVPDLQAWYERWYAPNNATLVVVGDVQAAEVFTLAQQYFGPLKPSELAPLKPQTEMPQLGERRMTLKLQAQLPYVMMGYKVPSLNTAKNPDEAYALEVLAGVLDGGNSARLSSKLVRGKQIAVSAGAGYDMTARLPELFILEGTPAKGKKLNVLEQALKQEILNLQKELVTRDELARVKSQVLAQSVYEQDSMFYQGMKLGMYETIGLGWQRSTEYVSKINQVTAEQVRDVANKYLLEDQLNVVYLEPQGMTKSAAQP